MLSKKALKNLKIGRDFLANHVKNEDFDMLRFRYDKKNHNYLSPLYPSPACGTVACLLGWMSQAPDIKCQIQSNNYYIIAKDVFGIDEDSEMFDFLFDARYVPYDNAREGAIGRIDAILQNPDLFDNRE